MNKIVKKSNHSGRQTAARDEFKVRGYDKYYLPASVFILSGIYFYLFGSYIFFYQENQSLFVFSRDYLEQFTSKPGGLLEYAGNFLTQLYFSSLYGTLIVSSVFASIAVVLLRINNKLSAGSSLSLLFAALGSNILILIQININYLIHNSLGFLSAGLYFLFSLSSDKKPIRILVLSFFPLFFYMTGAYAWIFLGMFTLHNLLNKRMIYALIIMIIAGLSLLLFKEIMFLQPWAELIHYPMPFNLFFSTPVILWILYLFFIFYPGLLHLAGSIQIRQDYNRTFSVYSLPGTTLLTILLLSGFYNKEVAALFKLEKMFFAGDWNGVIKQQERDQSKSLTAQYYYNTSLSESGMLCDRLFFAPQNYGSGSICIPWNSQVPISQMFRGVYFYYSIGLINEAHRWAFESMVIQGYRPENIKLLIKTELINGHYKIAEKYIYVLKRTLHYRNLAKKYEAMVSDPESIKSDPELGEKIKLKPESNFIVRIRDPYINISSLVKVNPDNKRAFEYEMAWLMLDRNLDGIRDEINKLAYMNYARTPRHIEEAALFIHANNGMLPEFNRLNISNETISRFSGFISSMMKTDRTKSSAGSGMSKELRNTFWYYLNFK